MEGSSAPWQDGQAGLTVTNVGLDHSLANAYENLLALTSSDSGWSRDSCEETDHDSSGSSSSSRTSNSSKTDEGSVNAGAAAGDKPKADGGASSSDGGRGKTPKVMKCIGCGSTHHMVTDKDSNGKPVCSKYDPNYKPKGKGAGKHKSKHFCK